MGWQLHVNRLAQDELDFELRCRGIIITGTVDKLRKHLREALKLEKENKLRLVEFIGDYKSDLTIIEEKLKTLNELITGYEGSSKTGNAYAKIETKFAHIFNRINRLTGANTEEENKRAKIMGTMFDLADVLDKKTQEIVPELSLLQLGNREEEARHGTRSVGDTSEEEDNIITSTPTSRMLPQSAVKSIPIIKWNLKFTAEPGSLSVNAFLEKVQDLSVARNVDQQQLFQSAYDLFDGKALQWYRAYRKKANNWCELVRLLKEEFQPPDHNERLFEEIKRRTQGKDESIGVYLAIMDSLFSRLNNKIEEAVKLKILLRNISPFYQTNLGLTEVNSIDELLKYGRWLEAKKLAVENFVPPSRRRSDLEPDLAYVDAIDGNTSSAIGEIAAVQHNNITCWNCRSKGHHARLCPQSKTMHCYKCGNPNFTVRTCPRCNPGNGSTSH